MKRNKERITKDMQIDEVIRKYPQTIDVFMSYGLHCIGCAMASFESIDQGAMVHGISKKTINQMMKEVNESAKSSLGKIDDKEILRITERALKQVILLKKKSSGSKYLRIALFETPYGNRYGFKFEKRKKKTDFLIDKGKMGFLLEKKHVKKMKGSTMDYLSFIPGNGFKVYPPVKN